MARPPMASPTHLLLALALPTAWLALPAAPPTAPLAPPLAAPPLAAPPPVVSPARAPRAADDAAEVALAFREPSVRVAPGGTFAWTVDLRTADVDALTLLAFDLYLDGGALEPARAPDDHPLAAADARHNPDGFGGVVRPVPGGDGRPDGARLLQVGGARDAFAAPTSTAPRDDAPLAFAAGTARAPRTPGRYALHLEQAFANLRLPDGDEPPARAATLSCGAPLVVVVDGDAVPSDAPPSDTAAPTPRAPLAELVVPPPRAGEPLRDLAPDDRDRFLDGRRLFVREFAAEEGLGPMFNDDSCDACHREPAAGGAHHRTVTRFGRSGPPFDALTHLGGTVLQFQSTHAAAIEFVPLESDVQTLRMTTPLFGLGLVDVLPDDALEALAASQPEDVRGRVNRVAALADGAPRVGRFGWKAQLATIAEFTGDALFEEMGLTNAFFPEENAPNGDRSRLAICDPVEDPEDRPDEHGRTLLDRLTAYQRLLAPPPQTPAAGTSGERVFHELGCADCHVPRLATPPGDGPLAGRTFAPYSDFLLHDMGATGDGLRQGDARPEEMRTAPLWGLVLRDAYMHDGASSAHGFEADLRDAVLRHDGQGAASRDRFSALPEAEVARLFAFLRSLGRAAFDHDGDNDLDAEDGAAVAAALTGPREGVPGAPPVPPDHPAAYADGDADGDVDLADLAAFQRAATGPEPWTLSPNSTRATARVKPGGPFGR